MFAGERRDSGLSVWEGMRRRLPEGGQCNFGQPCGSWSLPFQTASSPGRQEDLNSPIIIEGAHRRQRPGRKQRKCLIFLRAALMAG